MKVYGITGSIACGKSTVTHYLIERGYLVVDADLISRNALTIDQECILKVQELFGCVKDGIVDRKALGRIVFHDKNAKKQLEAIIHPYVILKMKEEIEKNIERHNHIRTGTLRRSIKTFKKKKRDGSPYIEVTATGSNSGPPGSKRKKYAGNAYIAFVLNYWRSNLVGSRFWTVAEQKAIEIFQPRLELKILNFLKEKGLK